MAEPIFMILGMYSYMQAIIEKLGYATLFKQRLDKQVTAETNTHAKMEERCFISGPPRAYNARTPGRLSAV
jgi:hypothetical protein